MIKLRFKFKFLIFVVSSLTFKFRFLLILSNLQPLTMSSQFETYVYFIYVQFVHCFNYRADFTKPNEHSLQKKENMAS